MKIICSLFSSEGIDSWWVRRMRLWCFSSESWIALASAVFGSPSLPFLLKEVV